MLVKIWHQSHAIFPDNPSGLVAILMVFESMVDRNSCHPDIHTRLQRIAFRIQSQNGRMLCDSIAQENHVNIVVEILFLVAL